MKSKMLVLVTAFVLSISSLGFICGEDEDPAEARVNILNSGYTISTVSYGSTSWTNLTYSNTPSAYKEIPTSSERIVIYCGGYTYTSAYQSAPEEGHKYTLNLSNSSTSCSGSNTFYFTVSED
jgi:hypothetical protein